ncbi:MAG: DUF3800 domain-containing protein [Terracoccus sp.]
MSFTAQHRRVVEIACDESGSEGEKLVGGSTDVFAHASVVVDRATALACIERVRVDARSPANEIKASVILRRQNRRVLEWLLDPAGPLAGRAHVHLTEKAYHLTVMMVDQLAPPGRRRPKAAAAVAESLHRDAAQVVGEQRWGAVLAGFNDGVRALPRAGRAVVLDPLVPALAAAVGFWGGQGRDGRAVSVVHDTQATLTPERLRHLNVLVGPGASERLSVRFVDSVDDPRVQIADFVAGAARRIASEALAGRADAGLTGLLRPYVDRTSVWSEGVTRALLVPPEEP